MIKLSNILQEEGLLDRTAGIEQPKGKLKIEGIPYRQRAQLLKGNTLADAEKIHKLLNEDPFWIKHGWDFPPSREEAKSRVDALRRELSEAEAHLRDVNSMVNDLKKVGINYDDLGATYDLYVTDEDGVEWQREENYWYRV